MIARWVDKAACADPGYDPEMWTIGRKQATSAANIFAIEVCADCPVKMACAAHGLLDGNRSWQIHGGLTPDQKVEIAGPDPVNPYGQVERPIERIPGKCGPGRHDLLDTGVWEGTKTCVACEMERRRRASYRYDEKVRQRRLAVAG